MAVPFTGAELDAVEQSLRNLAGPADSTTDYVQLRALLTEVAHLGHKEWVRTEAASARLAQVLGGPDDPSFRAIFLRVLRDGHWERAADYASAHRGSAAGGSKPWVVLVTGLNGIRKTTSIYEPWFKRALHAALQASDAAAVSDLAGNKKRRVEKGDDGTDDGAGAAAEAAAV